MSTERREGNRPRRDCAIQRVVGERLDWITDQIAIGNAMESRDAELIREQGIRSVLSLDGTMVGREEAFPQYSSIRAYRLIDGAGNDPGLYLRVIQSLAALHRSSPPVLVHCHAGRSRSVVVVAGFLMQRHGWDESEALDAIGQKREVALTPGIERLLDHAERG